MKVKPLVPRRQADDDADSAADFYLQEAGGEVALAFVHSIEHAYVQISRLPDAGLRFWKAKKFPYLIFYVDLGSRIEIWRVLHERMDLPAQILNVG